MTSKAITRQGYGKAGYKKDKTWYSYGKAEVAMWVKSEPLPEERRGNVQGDGAYTVNDTQLEVVPM